MFLDEARLAAQLQHPNIAQVYDVGKLGESYFFTMEYVHGITVRELMIRLAEKPVPLGAALSIAAGAAAGFTTRTSASASTANRSGSCTATSRRRI